MATKPDELATRVHDWLRYHNLNQVGFARRLGVSPKHLSQVLNGRSPLTHNMAVKLADVTGIDLKVWVALVPPRSRREVNGN